MNKFFFEEKTYATSKVEEFWKKIIKSLRKSVNHYFFFLFYLFT